MIGEESMNRRLRPYQTYGIALLRVSLGVYYVLHGYYGWLVIGVERFAALNASMGIPLPTISAWAVVLGHLVGGALLVIGLYARLGALMNAFIMAGAAAFVHFDQGFFMHGIVTNPQTGAAVAGGYEYSLFLLLATIAILLLGGGPLSIDALTRNRMRMGE